MAHVMRESCCGCGCGWCCILLLPADAVVDGLATVLRLLYIKDLRALQTAIDSLVVQVQVR